MSARETVIALEKSLLDPQVRASVADLDRLIADDFTEVGASGLIFGKQAVMDDLPQEQGITREASNFAARELAENVMMVTFVAVKRGDGPVKRSFRTSIWMKQGGQWQVVFHQGTMLAL